MREVEQIHRMGIDIGSTTLKIIILNDSDRVVYKSYRRHKANIHPVLTDEFTHIKQLLNKSVFFIQITGSAGLGISERIGIPFMQEVVASVNVVEKFYPATRTLIDLGGEDAKMVFFRQGRQPDIRMNGNCAGGTGAFIDQMADLLHISVEELGKQAKDYTKIYPVASRCGVFAKTDIQNLICRNISTVDISASILHTVALQSITSLARGYDIEPKVLCIGGPLTFIPALRDAFKRLLKLENDDMIIPENGEYFPAMGCAISVGKEESPVGINIDILTERLAEGTTVNRKYLPPLFKDETDYSHWKKNRNLKLIRRIQPEKGKHYNCFLGIDSGSTTTKVLVMEESGEILYTFYAPNEGNPLKKVIEGLQQFYDTAEKESYTFSFISSAATGYGEELIRSALNLDYGIVETMAHLSGAQYIDPEVSFILDIGGQDIKSLFVENGVISNIELNEACSSGCGSFLQNFASTMNLSLSDFARKACLSKAPSDLGTRCTVFMNSKVKQSLRDNADLGDIAAGLSYSVIKNCLYKVLKINNLNHLGDHIVVQGGTFRNDAVYRVLELLSGKTISSTDHPELMGALGAALYARNRHQTEKASPAFTGVEALPVVEDIDTKNIQCKGCTNQCSVLRFKFNNGNISYAGNKCEKVFYNKKNAPKKGYNAFEWKNNILFGRENKPANSKEKKQIIGIPRVLNMYENYPFWHTLFTECGFDVVLSPESTFMLYQKGAGSVMSENICFPAKLVHGHIQSLIEAKVDRIFFPIIPTEVKEFKKSVNSFHCPVISGYPDVIRSAMDPEKKNGIPFDKPVIVFSNGKAAEKECFEYLSTLGIDKNVFRKAFHKAQQERDKVAKELIHHQQTILNEALQKKKPLFIVAGRPYHTDPLINQKVGQTLSDLGVDVLTDDVFRTSPSEGFSKLNIVSQWAFPNRMVEAASEVAKMPKHIQYIQLNSFGCGPDSFFMDEVGDILQQAGKNHTVIRIDEIASSGSIRLRLRSLIESLKMSTDKSNDSSGKRFQSYPSVYKKEDRKKNILIPWFADFLSPFFPAIGELAGYNFINLPKSSKASAEIGLKYGHNEVCYPSTLVLGDIIMALQSGKYDLSNTIVAITQTGGQCRATNYISQIKRGLQNADFEHIPVLAISTGQVYQNDQKAFRIPVVKLVNIIVYGLLYADGLQQMYSATVIREKKKGEAKELFDFYIEEGIKAIRKNDHNTLFILLEHAIADFNQISVNEREYTKIGLIGEIYLKYNNYGQAHITEWLRSQNMEVISPPIMDFILPYFVNAKVNAQNGLDSNAVLNRIFRAVAWKFMNKRIRKADTIMQSFRYYHPTESIFTKASYASEILDLSHQFGEGWSIAAEVASYARNGVNKVVCVQPFGCIANHIIARGVEKRLKQFYPEMNLLFLDIDSGVAEVNLQNRLHFMLAYD